VHDEVGIVCSLSVAIGRWVLLNVELSVRPRSSRKKQTRTFASSSDEISSAYDRIVGEEWENEMPERERKEGEREQLLAWSIKN
jgi:hypothetical protein